MECRSCGLENPEGMDFCIKCATPLKHRCPGCDFDNPPQAEFCGKCATPLTARATPTGTRLAPEAERRQLTVMFCDLVGSTPLSQQIDAEELREVMSAYQETCGELIRNLGGEIAQYQGDGLLVYFGYPQAHEDDPVRAIRAALAILDELPRLSGRMEERLPALRENPLQVRIGIHTGPVVVGEMDGDAKREQFALGDTMNITSRLLGVCEPGWTVISEATRHLVHGVFIVEDLGKKPLRGIEDPVPVFRALRPSGVHGRLARATATGLTPLVGRTQEVSLLLDRWEQVNEGHGQVVLLSGEAGMGKSRLVQALRDRLTDSPHTWLECGCSPYHENSAFYPIVELLNHALLPDGGGTPEGKIARLEETLRAVGIALPDVVPLFATLLSLPVPEGYPTMHVSAEVQRRRTLESLAAWLFNMSEQQPVVLVVEDLHWIDPSSLELLHVLFDQAPTAPVLILLTFRPDTEVPWASRSHAVHLTLHRLTRKQVAAMVERITGGKDLPSLVLEHVVAKTDGVPLFVEELTRAVLESDLLVETALQFERADPLPKFSIPSTLQDSLMARLDRLGATKEVAQLAAVLGRDFSHDLLAAVSPLDPAALEDALAQLASAELLYRRGLAPRAVYTFKHALVQEAAYQSLLKRTRQRYHAKIAQVLEERFPERVASEPEVIARHCEEAGSCGQAIHYYERAGEHAAQRSAHPEAISHLTRGIELLTTLPESTERNQTELRLQVALGTPLLEARGYGDADVERAYARARELCQEIGEAPQLFQALWGLSVFYQARNELSTAVELGKQLLSFAGHAGDVSLLMEAHMSLGSPLFWRGEICRSLEHVGATIALYDPAKHRSLAYVYGEDPGVSSRIYAAQALWQLGFPDQALQRIREAVELAQGGTHPFSLGYALGFAAGIHCLRREPAQVREWAEKAIAIAEDQHLLLWLGLGRFFRGWALADPRGKNGGVEAIEEGVAEMAATGTEVGAPFLLGILAEAYSNFGRVDDGLRTVEDSLALAERRQSHFWDAELHRLKGELLLQRAGGAEPEAESCLRRALDVSRKHKAKSFELRASVSMSRRLCAQGKVHDARTILAGVYGWFKEGFATPDLKDAKALLDELS